jgi:EAL domain-containing protein (putative c-di-GMP-specific phosphodiesterase class I)/DNA-binding NarL/FixJ family response regulator
MPSSKVLIVDDINVNRMAIKLSLRDGDYQFFEASNGKEALETAIKEKPDVILMDAMMPEMDGFEATKKIREIESIRRIPILMITALEDIDDKIRALEMGVNDFISKPFDKTELIARCKSYIQISKLNQQYSLATINPITELPNKLALQKDITSSKDEMELFLIKVDNFDENENFYGNHIIEELERAFSTLLQDYFNDFGNITLYHTSSGKYALILNNEKKLTIDEAKNHCINFIESMKKTEVSTKDHKFNLNITMSYSQGLTMIYEDANALLNEALARKSEYLLGKDILEGIKERLRKNLNMIEQIKYAIKNDLFIPHFQPIFNNKTKSIYKYETLIRMKDSEGNITYPGPYLLEAAKKGRFYTQITKIIINKVFDKIRESDCEFSINLSSLDIEDEQMGAYLLDSIKKNSDLTHKLIFELLEDKDTQDYEVVNNFIKIAKKYGVKIAIDDFGSGYSNFMRILEFEPDIIKIDGSLIEDITTNKTARNTVEMIKLFADKIGAKTVAEYVENEEIYNIINDLGIDYSQGYYIAKATEELVKEKVFDTLEEA